LQLYHVETGKPIWDGCPLRYLGIGFPKGGIWFPSEEADL
jgi:hypothetical protein